MWWLPQKPVPSPRPEMKAVGGPGEMFGSEKGEGLAFN